MSDRHTTVLLVAPSIIDYISSSPSLEYERVYLSLKVADTPFHTQGDFMHMQNHPLTNIFQLMEL